MNINFSILWFDDSETYFDSLDISALEGQIRDWGFRPQIEKVTTPDKFLECVNSSHYDLIVVDYNLEGYPGGQEFIANIRGNSIYTEVIFYTAGSVHDLWKQIHDKELEGVFVSSRGTVESKITKVGYQSVRKVLDIENMRGIVMAEVGEIDLIFHEIIEHGLNYLDDDKRTEIFTRFHKKMVGDLKNSLSDMEKFGGNPGLAEMLLLCDTNKLWENFNRITKHIPELKDIVIGNYIEEVVHPRNSLAHGVPTPHADGGIRFVHRGKEYIFDQQRGVELRKLILVYKSTLHELLEAVKKMRGI